MRAVSLAFLCLLAAGCRVDPNVVLLERENRQLEDRIYQLEDALTRAQAGLDTCQVTSTSPPSVIKPNGAVPTREAPAPTLDVPAEQAPATRPSSPLQPPKVLLPSDNGKAAPRNPDGSQRLLPMRRPLPTATAAAYTTSVPTPTELTRDNRRIQQIAIQPRLTGGYDADGQPGHEGITTFVQFRDAQGRLLRTAAPISVAVVDKAMEGSSSRVARWDFSAQEVAARWRRTSLGEGVMLHALWPKDPPAHPQLRLYVRLTTDDGRKLDAIRDIEVTPPQLAAAGWSPAVPKELPPQDAAVPLSQPKTPPRAGTPQVAATQPPAEEPAAEPVEPSAAPILELPDDAGSASEEPKEAPPPRTATKRSPPAEPVVQRPVWSPYRR